MGFNNRTVINSTRKEHQCFGCLKKIPVGSKAINDQGYSESWYNHYMHVDCAELISKHHDFFFDGVPENAVNELIDYYGDEL